MVRRLVAGVAVGLVLFAGTASAQNSPSPTTIIITTTTTTTTEPTTTTTQAVSPTTVEQTTTTVAPTSSSSVLGVVVSRPLPRTGSDIGPEVILGAGLTATGLAFAIAARLRRQRATANVAP